MAMDRDLYGVLGVSEKASQSEIKKAFHKLAKQYHPDVNSGDKGAEQKFKEVNLAYEVLKDPKKRGQYDQMRSMGAGNPFGGGGRPGWGPQGGAPFGGGDMGLGDLFDDIFGDIFGNPPQQGPQGPMGRRASGRPGRGAAFRQRGGDQEAELIVSFLEAARGGERVIDLPNGKRLSVTIPEGVEDGSKIRLSGQGQAGMGGGPAGDLILHLKTLEHSFFERQGKDILLRLPIAFSEAILGAEVEIPTLDGPVQLRIPKGVSTGQRLKLRGKGVRARGAGKRGDQLVEVAIVVPKHPGKNYINAAKELADASFNPREGLF